MASGVQRCLEVPRSAARGDSPCGTVTLSRRLRGTRRGTLRDALRRGPLPLARALRIVDEVLAGLEMSHALGLAHGNVSPENIVFARDGGAQLAELALARVTPTYMSPEQARGERAAPASDVYAIGCVLHEMLVAHVDVPGAVGEVIARALAHAPAERPATAGALRGELQAALSSLEPRRTLRTVRVAAPPAPLRALFTGALAVMGAGFVLGMVLGVAFGRG